MTAPDDPFGWVGSILDGKYRVDEVVGEGGFGVVYAGHHLAFDEPIAIKCLKLDAAVPSALRQRFLAQFMAEGRILYRLSQATPDIVRAIDVGTATAPSGEWTPYIVLEWIRGETLEHQLSERAGRGDGGRSLREAIELLQPAARALDAAHERGVAHRDVKPSNLILTEVRGRPTIKVLDFGVAKVVGAVKRARPGAPSAETSIRAFSPPYGAPEQFDRALGATGPWTDVFAMALVLVEVVAGRRALAGGDMVEQYLRSTDVERRPTLRACGVPASDEIERVLRRALAVDPRNRFERAGDFWDEIVAASRAEATVAGESSRLVAVTRVEGTEIHERPRTIRQPPSHAALAPVSRTVDDPCLSSERPATMARSRSSGQAFVRAALACAVVTFSLLVLARAAPFSQSESGTSSAAPMSGSTTSTPAAAIELPAPPIVASAEDAGADGDGGLLGSSAKAAVPPRRRAPSSTGSREECARFQAGGACGLFSKPTGGDITCEYCPGSERCAKPPSRATGFCR